MAMDSRPWHQKQGNWNDWNASVFAEANRRNTFWNIPMKYHEISLIQHHITHNNFQLVTFLVVITIRKTCWDHHHHQPTNVWPRPPSKSVVLLGGEPAGPQIYGTGFTAACNVYT